MAKKKVAVKKKTSKKKAETTAREFAIEAAKIALHNNCTDVVVLDLTGKSPATDYFIIATGTSDRQTRTVADDITEYGKKHDFKIFGRAGYDQGKWVLLDFVTVVVHVFNEEFRQFYDLELLWGDAEKLKIEE
ncbi:MAG: ribosome silencing factor [Planctomycetaceae bacterium]|nr:ribosome silencing factor [Planctomycetaceae bacterium]